MHKGHILSSLRKGNKARFLFTGQKNKFPGDAEAEKQYHCYSKGPIREYLSQLPTPLT